VCPGSGAHVYGNFGWDVREIPLAGRLHETMFIDQKELKILE